MKIEDINNYNSEKFIDSAVNSIINQTYKNLELIVMDDSSSDGTYNLLQNFEKKDNKKKEAIASFLIYKELIHLPTRFTAARDLERISPFRGTKPREGALAWALSLSR